MKNAPGSFLFLVWVSLVGLSVSRGAAQQPGGGAFSKPPTNLKILKVEKAEDLRPIMRSYNAALGVECDFCHVRPDFAKDTKAHKEVARKMIEMVDKINSQIFAWDAAPKATCHMCHNGNVYPKFNPPAQLAPLSPGPPGAPLAAAPPH